MRKIVTSPTHSPLPTRQHDWCAHYDGEEEAGNYGYGATEEAAIADFIENCQEDHDERWDPPVNLLTAVQAHRSLTASQAMITNLICADVYTSTSLDSVREGSEHQMEAAE